MPLLFRAMGTTRESLTEGAKQKHTQREGLCDLSIRSRGGGGQLKPGDETPYLKQEQSLVRAAVIPRGAKTR